VVVLILDDHVPTPALMHMLSMPSLTAAQKEYQATCDAHMADLMTYADADYGLHVAKKALLEAQRRATETDDMAQKSFQQHLDAFKKLREVEDATQAKEATLPQPPLPVVQEAFEGEFALFCEEEMHKDAHTSKIKMAGRKTARMRAQPYVLPDLHDMDCILNHKVVTFPNSERLLFQVRWVGFPHAKDFTWEPRSRAKGFDAKRMFQAYMAKHNL